MTTTTPPDQAPPVTGDGPEADPLAAAVQWRAQGRAVALATVIRTWGSSPRPVGSQLAVSSDGSMVGSVSGGCVEGSVVEQALQVIGDGEPRILSYGVTSERAWEVGLACGGQIEILVQSVGRAHAKRDLLERVLRARSEDRPVALVTDLITGLQTLVFDSVIHGAFGLEGEALGAVTRCLAAGRSALVEPSDDERLFVAVFVPPPRLMVVGAVHIAQTLVPMARLAGYHVTVIDPRRSFSGAYRFPGTQVIDAWPDEALASLVLDNRSAVVTLTHDPKLDEPALVTALRSPAFYIGALGSRRTHSERLARLACRGFGEAELARIHGPVGLAIGAETPAEIAISILAELTAAFRNIP